MELNLRITTPTSRPSDTNPRAQVADGVQKADIRYHFQHVGLATRCSLQLHPMHDLADWDAISNVLGLEQSIADTILAQVKASKRSYPGHELTPD